MSETHETPKARNHVTHDGDIVFLTPPDGADFTKDECIAPSTLLPELLQHLAGRQIAGMLRVSSDPIALIALLKRGELPKAGRRYSPSDIERAVLAARAARAKREGTEFDEAAVLASFRRLPKALRTDISSTIEVAKELQKIRGKDAADPLAF